MIKAENGLFVLHTANTTYAFCADQTGNLIHLYYGKKIEFGQDALKALMPKINNQNGCSIIADTNNPNLCLDDVCLEISTRGKGDMREPLVEIEYADGSRTSDFRYKTCKLVVHKEMPEGLPGAYFESEEGNEYRSLIVTLQDRNSDVQVELVYSVFEKSDCITRFTRVKNPGKEKIKIHRAMSAQLDAKTPQWKLTSFHGDWAREMNRYDTLLQAGKYVNDSVTGFTSNKTNTFVMFGDVNVTEMSGNCYAYNLMYSGNHKEIFEASGHGKMHMVAGVNPAFFQWTLLEGESFTSPEAVLTFSDTGYRGISRNMHDFVREHVVRGEWKKKERPVLVNSWEAMYMDVKESKILKLAKAAKEVGIELFVLDDGWFGKRNDDKTSLGDWHTNREKLPDGLKGVSKKIREMGLLFGLWVEPEMVNEDSDLYRAHPQWAVRIPGKDHALGRNQMLLDLTNKEVQDYIVEQMSDVFTRSEVSYIKWDMNRHVSDYYSQGLPEEKQGEFSHRYILGLYSVLDRLTKAFPHILFEGCASGGNRFDLGILSYMPQIWASDCTDAISRGIIQNGYSYGYPQSVIGAHVSGSPNHQTLRHTPLATRFAVASAGILGYEYNLADAKAQDLAEIKQEVALYKEWRSVLQFGEFIRINSGNDCAFGNLSAMNQSTPFDTDVIRWNIVSEDKTRAVGIVLQGQAKANFGHRAFHTIGLDDNKVYHFSNRILKYDVRLMGDLINTMAPVHVKQDSLMHDMIAKFVKLDGEVEDVTVSGSLLNNAGIELADGYGGTGFGTNTAIYADYDARLFFIEEV